MAEWWRAHLEEPPLVVIRCGRGEPRCKNAIGEIKTIGGRTLAMNKNERPEPVVPWTPIGALTRDELEAAVAKRENRVLRRFGTEDDPKIVYKRPPNRPRAVAPIEFFSQYSCRKHGEVQIDVAHLTAFVGDTQTPRRTYWANRALD
jgi:hypothetical protein